MVNGEKHVKKEPDVLFVVKLEVALGKEITFKGIGGGERGDRVKIIRERKGFFLP